MKPHDIDLRDTLFPHASQMVYTFIHIAHAALSRPVKQANGTQFKNALSIFKCQQLAEQKERKTFSLTWTFKKSN